MPFTQPTMATNNVSSLDTYPNDNTGLTPAQLKAVYDKFGVDTKPFLVNLLSELDAADAQNTKLTGNQSIAGVKTFVSSPIVPTPTTDMQVANKKFVLDNSPVADGSITDIKLSNVAGQIKSQLSDNAISPENYTGNSLQKISQAIQDAITLKKAVKFSRYYDITGLGAIIINKPANDRTILYLIGVGGGIKKTDNGYIFSATSVDMGDIVSTCMKYESINGGGVKVWDANKLIRVSSILDSYVNVDMIAEANTRYMQTFNFNKCNITGGNGWAFEWKNSFDVTIDNNAIEHRENGIRNTAYINDPDNNTLRITNNRIQGLTGKAIELGSCFGSAIKNNYLELCPLGYIDLSKSLNYHNGLSLEGNTMQLSQTQKDNLTPAIILGKMGNYGVDSRSNVSTGVLYKTVLAGTPGKISSISDVSYLGEDFKVIGEPSLLLDLGYIKSKVDAITGTLISYGAIKKYSNTVQTTVTPANGVNTTSVNLGIPVTNTDIVSIRIEESGAANTGRVINWTGTATGLNIVVNNVNSSEQYFIIYVTVLKLI